MASLAGGHGAMVSLALAADAAQRLATGLPVNIAGLNARSRTVMAGPADAIDALAARARSRGATATRLRVSHAFHSPLVAPAAEALARVLAAEQFSPPGRKVISTVTGTALDCAENLRALLCRQVTEPVRFAQALTAAAEDVDLFIEAGPGRVLSGLAGESVAVPAIALDAGGGSLSGLLCAAGAAWSLGAPVRVDALFDGRFTRPFDVRRRLSFLSNPCERAPLNGAPFEAGAASTRREPTVEAPPSDAPDARVDPLGLVLRLVAERAEMPTEAISASSRMLDDLHLTSIAVGEIAVEAARRLGLDPPAAPNELANATVAQLAEALDDPRLATPGTAPVEVAGAGSWVRPFTVEWVSRPLQVTSDASTPGRWRVFAARNQPFAEPLSRALERAGGEGVALCVPRWPADDTELMLEAVQAALSAPRFLVVQEPGATAAGLARSVHLEAPGCSVAVVTLALDASAPGRAAAEALAATSFTEARYDGDLRFEPALRHFALAEEHPLPIGPGDTVLVTGGARGIAAECMLRLARVTGAALAIVGRSDPAEAEVAANLERLRAAGVKVSYARADVTDPAALRSAVSELGPVTAVVHAAGANEPRLLAEADAALFARTLAPKVGGLEAVVAAVDVDRLRMLVTFGSIIARMGLRGDAHYALANELQSALTERFAAEHPGCVCLAFESSVWSAVGMGERLGSVEALARQGVASIAPDEGAALLERLLRCRDRPTTVLVCGRFGRPATLNVERAELPLLRFLERPLVHYPGVELVAEADLTHAVDPYLCDHVLNGDSLLPAVVGLEAMGQAIAGLTGSTSLPVFSDLRLARPVIVPEGEMSTVRVAVLADDAQSGTAVVRSERTGFSVDHFSATWALDAARGSPVVDLPIDANGSVALDPGELYGGLLFQSGRLRRLRGYKRLTGTECVAEIGPGTSERWFGPYLPQGLVLGDPGARDAALHALQACIPHARVVPVAVRALWPCAGDGPGPWTVHARERERSGDEFVFDLMIVSADGAVRERWDGVRFRAVGPAPADAGSRPEALLVPFVERHLPAGVRVALNRDGAPATRRERSRRAVSGALDADVALHNRPDGRPEATGVPGSVSTAHARDLTLAVAGSSLVACDLEPVRSRAWGALLGGARATLSAEVARQVGEDPNAAATRVWAAAECLVKAGIAAGAPLAVRGLAEDGWLTLASGAHVVGTYVTTLREGEPPLAIAILTGAADASL